MSSTDSASKQGTELHNSYMLPVVVLIGLVVFGALASSLTPKQHNLPAELMGVWKTDEANHSDRFLELSLVSVSFGTGSGTVSTGFIRKVAIVPEGSRTLYTVTYRDEQGDQDLSFYYQPAAETLQLKNQKQIVWRKTQDN